MRGSVLLIVFFSLTVTQCTLKGERPSPGNEDPHFKSTEGSIENLAHGKSSGGIVNYIKPCGIVSGVNPNITEYCFGDDNGVNDDVIARIVQYNIFNSKQDLDVAVSYPAYQARSGKFIITQIKVMVAHPREALQGSAEILDGGINQNHFTIRTTAVDAEWYIHHIFVHGYKL